MFPNSKTVYEFEFERKYGGWVHDNRADVDPTKSSHNMNLSCHDRCLVSSPQLFLNHENPEGANYLAKSDIVSLLQSIVQHTSLYAGFI